MTVWAQVWREHAANVGFRSGPHDENPWTEEIGAGDAAYCISAASIVPYHQGVRWWADSQFGEKGYAYCPYAMFGAIKHGCWQADHASRGAPCDLMPGDITLYDWNNDGVADHAETVTAVYADLTFDTVGYNTGDPAGCYHPVRRNRYYLLGRIRMDGTFYHPDSPPPPLPGGPMEQDYNPPFTVVGVVVSSYEPASGGAYLFTDQGYVYAFGCPFAGGPAEDQKGENWKGGSRVGARIGPPDTPGKLYTCVDTAGERYTY